MIAKTTCLNCHSEITAEVYQGFDYPGFYVECPECETEILVKEEQCFKHKRDDDDFDWEDSIEDAISDTQEDSSLAAI